MIYDLPSKRSATISWREAYMEIFWHPEAPRRPEIASWAFCWLHWNYLWIGISCSGILYFGGKISYFVTIARWRGVFSTTTMHRQASTRKAIGGGVKKKNSQGIGVRRNAEEEGHYFQSPTSKVDYPSGAAPSVGAKHVRKFCADYTLLDGRRRHFPSSSWYLCHVKNPHFSLFHVLNFKNWDVIQAIGTLPSSMYKAQRILTKLMNVKICSDLYEWRRLRIAFPWLAIRLYALTCNHTAIRIIWMTYPCEQTSWRNECCKVLAALFNFWQSASNYIALLMIRVEWLVKSRKRMDQIELPIPG